MTTTYPVELRHANSKLPAHRGRQEFEDGGTHAHLIQHGGKVFRRSGNQAINAPHWIYCEAAIRPLTEADRYVAPQSARKTG